MKNLTPVSTFTSPVQTVEDGDSGSEANFETTAQALTNRTEKNKDDIAALQADVSGARFNITAVGNTSGDGATVTLDFGTSGFAVASAGIQFPSNGKYLVSVKVWMRENTSTSNPKGLAHSLNLGADLATAAAASDESFFTEYRWSSTTSDPVHQSFTDMVEVTDYANEQLYLVNASGGSDHTIASGVGANSISIVKVAD